MDLDADLGRRIADLRRARELRQEDFLQLMAARGISWTQTTLSRIEAGKRPLKAVEAFAVAESLMVNVSELNPSSDSLFYDISRLERRLQELVNRARAYAGMSAQIRGELVAVKLAEKLKEGRQRFEVDGTPLQFVTYLSLALSDHPDPLDSSSFALKPGNEALGIDAEMQTRRPELQLSEAYRMVFAEKYPELKFSAEERDTLLGWFDVKVFTVDKWHRGDSEPSFTAVNLFNMLYGPDDHGR